MIGCDCEVCISTDKKDNRLRSSIMVKSPTTTFVIDTTPDFRYQMLRTETKHIDAVVFTHPHKDHMAGLDDIRPFYYFSQKPMELYANTLTEEALRRDFYYAFSENKYPGVPEINLNTIDETPFMIGDIEIIPIKVWHMKMMVYGYRIGNFTYITDANYITDKEKEKIKGSKVVVLNALRKKKHVSHFNLEEAVSLLKEINPERAYLTHISHMMGLHEDVEKELPDFIKIAYDKLTIDI